MWWNTNRFTPQRLIQSSDSYNISMNIHWTISDDSLFIRPVNAADTEARHIVQSISIQFEKIINSFDTIIIF